MQLISRIIVAVSLLCAHIVYAQTIIIARQSDLDASGIPQGVWKASWSYQVVTDGTAAKVKSFKKETKISFDEKKDNIVVHVYQNANGSGEHKDITLLENGTKKYTAHQNIFVKGDGSPVLLAKTTSPFAKTHKVSVEKLDSDGKVWTIQARNTDTQASKGDTVEYVYSVVTIKKNTNPGKGLTVPVSKSFAIVVQALATEQNGKLQEILEKDAKRLKKITITRNGTVKGDYKEAVPTSSVVTTGVPYTF